jgi:hypothetical protein
MSAFLALAIVIGLILYWVYQSKKPQPSELNRGERAVVQDYQQHFQAPYLLLNNCTLPDADNGTTQIDHIILSPYGVFVLESKDYQGWIFGLEYDKKWRQSLGQHKSYEFQNPIRQNFKHIKVLQHLLADVVDAQYFHSVIVFTPRSKFKNQMPEYVCRGDAWVNYVKTFQQDVISPMKLKRLQMHLQRHLLENSPATDQLHINHLQRKYADQD